MSNYKDNFQKAGIDARWIDEPMNTERHTAIVCEHQVANIRARMVTALSQTSLTAFLSTDHPDHEINDLIDFIVTAVASETISIMTEHAQEIASEYAKLLKGARK